MIIAVTFFSQANGRGELWIEFRGPQKSGIKYEIDEKIFQTEDPFALQDGGGSTQQ